jgi:7-keto-8-aminopelargonate synthetase-like enzyme
MATIFILRAAGDAGNSFASIGGFCAGSREIVDHQRLR